MRVAYKAESKLDNDTYNKVAMPVLLFFHREVQLIGGSPPNRKTFFSNFWYTFNLLKG